jgi:hypothetical protein
MEYGHERVIVDGVKVNYDIHKIDTGSRNAARKSKKLFYVDKRGRFRRKHAARVLSIVNTDTFRFDNTKRFSETQIVSAER